MRFLRVLIVVALIVSLFGNFVMYMKWSGKRPIFSVNGQGVSKRDLDNYLEVLVGPSIKAKFVQNMLIEQEAKKQGVLPDAKEVEEAINEQKETNWQFAREIQMKPWMLDEAKNNQQRALAQVRLLTKGIEVRPEQIQEEYRAHPERYDTPNKAVTQFAAILDPSRATDIKELLEKPVDPPVIMRQMPKAAAFLGNDYKLTITQAYGTKQNQVIFSMKPNQVKIIPADASWQRIGAKALVVRVLKFIPGHKADLNDPKTKERISLAVAARSAKPWQEYLAKLWADTKFECEDPNDRKIVEALFFPDRMQTASAAGAVR